MTRPNCEPKLITSVSLASFGIFLIWITRDGLPAGEGETREEKKKVSEKLKIRLQRKLENVLNFKFRHNLF